jgi:hypothetical protein
MTVIPIGVLLVEGVYVDKMDQTIDNARERADFLSIRESLLRQWYPLYRSH